MTSNSEHLQHLMRDFRSSQFTINQKHGKIRDFVKQVESTTNGVSSVEDIDDLLESIEPTDFSAKRLKLELANHFKRPLIILEYIKTEEKLLVKRALQFHWIFTEPTSPLNNPKTLVRIILPSLSYLTRLRIIRLLALHWNNEIMCEEMFALIQEKFGILSAIPFLPCCSTAFIQNCLESKSCYLFTLNGAQLLKIAKKSHQIAVSFLRNVFKIHKSNKDQIEIYNACKNEQETLFHSSQQGRRIADEDSKHVGHKLRLRHKETLEYLCGNYPDDFLELYNDFIDVLYFCIWPSPKTTRALLRSPNCRAQILSNPSKYQNILKNTIVKKMLSDDELVNFVLPSTIETFIVEHEQIFENWLKLICGKKAKWEALKTAFKLKYGEDIEKFPECITPTIMKIMGDGEREVWAQLKLQQKDSGRTTYYCWESLPDSPEGFWTSFLPIESSIQKLKQLANEESDMKLRSELLKYMVNSCAINQRNMPELVELCRYVLGRYRNDSQQLRQVFLSEIQNEFKISSMIKDDKSGIWEVLEDFLKLAAVYKEPENTTILEFLLQHKIFMGKSTESLESMFQMAIVNSHGSWLGDDLQSKSNYYDNVKMQFFQLHLAQLEKLYNIKTPMENYSGKELSILKSAMDMLINHLLQRMKKSKKHFRNMFTLKNYPWLSTRLWEMSAEMDHSSDSSDEEMSTKINQLTKHDAELHDKFLKQSLSKTPFSGILSCLLKNDPGLILETVESVMEFILGSEKKVFRRYRNFFTLLKTQGFLEISSAFVELCLEYAQDEGKDESFRSNALVVLSYLWDSNNYLSSLSLFYPIDPQIDLTDQSFESQFSVRKTIVESLSHTGYPGKCFPSIRRFCLGDYLKMTVGPLNSVCLNAPHLEAVQFLKEDLLDSPVSVKKHAIKLLIQISNQDEIDELLSYLWDNETNTSTREVIMSRWVAIFAINHSELEWKQLQAVISSLSIKDKNIFFMMMRSQLLYSLPRDLLPKYIRHFHNSILNANDANSILKSDLLSNFLDKVCEHESDLRQDSQDIVIELLESYLFNLNGNEEISMLTSNLAAKFILNYTKTDVVINFLSKKLKELKEQWDIQSFSKIRVVDGSYVFDRDVLVRPSPVALSRFVTAVCRQISTGVKKETKEIVINRLGNIIEGIQNHFDGTEVLCEQTNLELVRIFYKHSKNNFASRIFENEDLIDIGKELKLYIHSLVKEYGSLIIGIFCDHLHNFFEDICSTYKIDDNDFIFILLGLVTEEADAPKNYSDEISMIACKLIPNFPSKTPTFVKACENVGTILMNCSNKAVQAQLHMKKIGL